MPLAPLLTVVEDGAEWDDNGVLSHDGVTLVRHGSETAPTRIDLFAEGVLVGNIDLTWNGDELGEITARIPSGDWVKGDAYGNVLSCPLISGTLDSV